LTADAAATRGHHNIHLIGEAGELERLGGVMLPREIREILLDGALVHREFSRTRAQENARDGFLAATGPQKPIRARDGRD